MANKKVKKLRYGLKTRVAKEFGISERTLYKYLNRLYDRYSPSYEEQERVLREIPLRFGHQVFIS